MHLSPLPYVRATCLAILSFLIWSLCWYLVGSKDNEAPHYIVFSTLLWRRCEYYRKPNVTTAPNLFNYIVTTAECNVTINFIAHALYLIVYAQSGKYRTVSAVYLLPCLDTVSPASYDDILPYKAPQYQLASLHRKTNCYILYTRTLPIIGCALSLVSFFDAGYKMSRCRTVSIYLWHPVGYRHSNSFFHLPPYRYFNPLPLLG
jgi:hypothetical protein